MQVQSIPGSYWQWQGHSIYYVRAGQSQKERPPLLLIHGFGASTDHWKKNIARLQQDFEVWAIDLLGFGRSAKPNLSYNGDLWRDQLNDFVERVIDRPVVLAGNSLGGYCALYLAASRPETAAGLILLNCAGSFSEPEVAQKPPFVVKDFSNRLIRSILLQPWANYLLFQYVRQRSVIRKTLEKVYLDRSAVTDSLVEDIYRPSLDKGALEVFASVFKAPKGETNDLLLAKLACPLLMLWGEADPWMNARERGSLFRTYYPTLTEYYLQAGHCPHDEVPDRVNASILAWVLSRVKPIASV